MGGGLTAVLGAGSGGSWVGLVALIEAAAGLDGVELGEGLFEVVAGDLVVLDVESVEDGLVE
jgi:hypothetical protein